MKRSGEATSEPPKVVRTPSVLYIFTSKCASRHNGVHFFNIRTSKSGANYFDSASPKVARTCSVLYILTSKCASRHNGVHFFNISTSKSGANIILTSKCLFRHLNFQKSCVFCTSFTFSTSGPNLVCFVHFDLEMCFAPQRRALFRHLNFQKWSDTGVFCTF